VGNKTLNTLLCRKFADFKLAVRTSATIKYSEALGHMDQKQQTSARERALRSLSTENDDPCSWLTHMTTSRTGCVIDTKWSICWAIGFKIQSSTVVWTSTAGCPRK
jgi:hypothetical protein